MTPVSFFVVVLNALHVSPTRGGACPDFLLPPGGPFIAWSFLRLTFGCLLRSRRWDKLNLVRVYTKPKGKMPDYSAPVVLRSSRCTVEDFVSLPAFLLCESWQSLVAAEAVTGTCHGAPLFFSPPCSSPVKRSEASLLTGERFRRKCNAIHRSIVENFRTAIVYGKSVKHQPQRVGLAHELADEDIGT